MSDITIWHNPRCSKSRAALALLQDKGIDPTIRLYLQDPPTTAELHAALALLDIPAIHMMRPKEPEFRAMDLSKTDDDDTLIAAMAASPKLIERPIVFAHGKAALGRPPEHVLTIL